MRLKQFSLMSLVVFAIFVALVMSRVRLWDTKQTQIVVKVKKTQSLFHAETIDVGNVTEGSSGFCTFVLHNRSHQPVRISTVGLG